MNKAELFLAALRKGNHLIKDWVISAFALTMEAPDAWEKDPYPFRLTQQGTRFFYFDEATMALAPVDGGYDPNLKQPLYNAWEKLKLSAGSVPNLKQDIETTYGNLLWNYLILVGPFGEKIPYINDRVSPGKLEGLIKERYVDDTPEKYPADAKNPPEKQQIYTTEYLACREAAFYSAGFAHLWVPADTPKTLTPPPGIKEFKQQLYKEFEGRLKDPAVIAEIDKRLVAYDAEYLKGDRSEGFLISNKSRGTVRRKLFLQLGAEAGLGEGESTRELITNSLDEGWDISKFAIMNDAQRAGSFSRGAQTMLGGESVKWLLRASSNLRVLPGDCGAKLGVPTLLDEGTIKNYRGFNVVTASGFEKLTEETEGKYLGKEVMVRSTQFCRKLESDLCEVCAGPRLSLNPTAASAAITAIGSIIMQTFLAAAHGTALTVATMDPYTELQ